MSRRRQHLGDAEQQRQRDARLQHWLDVDANDRRWVMSSPQGRRFMERQLLWAITKVAGPQDNASMQHLEGQRFFAATLWNQLQRECPSEFAQLLSEQSRRVVEEEQFLRAAETEPDEPSAPDEATNG